ncbi:helix-turn-helix domain-containing protein [Klenkia terrae]|uniref:helix-turn-helix domain-containing protein n=1 Tax=Klenkia terrae TaxID=1052259 RepID=UPI003609253E
MFSADRPVLSLSEVAGAAELARPTARRLLLTLEELGYVAAADGGYRLTPKVLSLGMAYIGSLGLWDIARPHLEALVARTGSPRRWPSSTGPTSSTSPGSPCRS